MDLCFRTLPSRSSARRIIRFIGVLICQAGLMGYCLAASAVVTHERLAVIPARVQHVFTYRPPANAAWVHQVNVAGDFNNWSPSANALHRTVSGAWKISVKLTPGLHAYKFVLNGNHWIPDPAANPALNISDGQGGINSQVRVASPWQTMPAPQANRIDPRSISFQAHNPQQVDVISRHYLRVELTAQSGALSDVAVDVVGPDATVHADPLRLESTYLGATTWGTILDVQTPSISYYFTLTHGTARRYVAGAFLYHTATAAKRHCYHTIMRSNVVTPGWAKRAIWYEIFPERFRNGNKANDPKPHIPWRWNWTEPYRPAGEHGKFYSYVYNRFYGGDILGIQDELPYLRRLGVNSLYLTPVFESPSIHKYDPSSFIHIDDGFGVKGALKKLHGENPLNPKTWQWSASDKLFLRFLKVAHRQGFKVIIDIPYGHCGKNFGPFQNVLKYGRKSPYASWFQIISWGPPVQYKAWDGVDKSMPMFALSKRYGLAKGVRNYLFAATRRWLAPNGNPADGVDGFRLDTAPDVPHVFWIAWRKMVKKIKPQAVIIGEVWPPAQAWLNKGNQFDAVMNYPFATIVTNYFANQRGPGLPGIGPKRFGNRLMRLLNWYPYQVDLDQMNIIDSQDTDQFVSRFMNPTLGFNADDRLQTNPHYNASEPTPTAYQRLEQTVAFQMSFVGAPCIWYGDEVGMWGASDPANRQPMVWKDLEPYAAPGVRVHERVLRFYRQAIAMRRQLKALQLGFYGQLLAHRRRDTFAFYRSLGSQNVYIAINRSANEQRVRIPIFKRDRDHHLLNYLNPRQMRLKFPPATDIKGRPILIKTGTGYLTRSKTLTLDMKPWTTVVLAR
ncbi:MAG: glycoside hydrolase family 13 protein [Phycisphaerae bacterium]